MPTPETGPYRAAIARPQGSSSFIGIAGAVMVQVMAKTGRSAMRFGRGRAAHPSGGGARMGRA